MEAGKFTRSLRNVAVLIEVAQTSHIWPLWKEGNLRKALEM